MSRWAAQASRIRTCSECKRHCRPATTSTRECCRGAQSTRPSPSPSAGVGAARRSRPGCGPRRVRRTCPCSTSERWTRSSVASQNGILWCWFCVQRTALAEEGKIGGLPAIAFFFNQGDHDAILKTWTTFQHGNLDLTSTNERLKELTKPRGLLANMTNPRWLKVQVKI